MQLPQVHKQRPQPHAQASSSPHTIVLSSQHSPLSPHAPPTKNAQVGRVLPGPAGKLQELAAAGALQQATPEVLGLRPNSGAAGLSPSQAAARHADAAFLSSAWAEATAVAAEDNITDGVLQCFRLTHKLYLQQTAAACVYSLSCCFWWQLWYGHPTAFMLWHQHTIS